MRSFFNLSMSSSGWPIDVIDLSKVRWFEPFLKGKPETITIFKNREKMSFLCFILKEWFAFFKKALHCTWKPHFFDTRLDWESYSDILCYYKCEYYICFGSISSDLNQEIWNSIWIYIFSEVIEAHAQMGNEYTYVIWNIFKIYNFVFKSALVFIICNSRAANGEMIRTLVMKFFFPGTIWWIYFGD